MALRQSLQHPYHPRQFLCHHIPIRIPVISHPELVENRWESQECSRTCVRALKTGVLRFYFYFYYYYVSKDPIKQPLAQFASSKQEWSEDEASKKRDKDGDPDFSYKSGWWTDDVACLTSPEMYWWNHLAHNLSDWCDGVSANDLPLGADRTQFWHWSWILNWNSNLLLRILTMTFYLLDFDFPLSGWPWWYNFHLTVRWFFDTVFISRYDFCFTMTLGVALITLVVDVP